jgi:hypothetical protein
MAAIVSLYQTGSALVYIGRDDEETVINVTDIHWSDTRTFREDAIDLRDYPQDFEGERTALREWMDECAWLAEDGTVMIALYGGGSVPVSRIDDTERVLAHDSLWRYLGIEEHTP